jgi:hypothetical protein
MVVSIEISVFEALCTRSPRFAEIWTASLAPTFLVGYGLPCGGRQLRKCVARRSSLRRGSLRPVLSPEGPAASFRA